MKQFGKILKFELKGYLRNKVFVGFTIFLVVVIAAVMFLPNLIALFKGENDQTSDTELPVMLIYAENDALAEMTSQYFTPAFANYQVKLAEGDLESVKSQVLSGEAECAFSMNEDMSYTQTS